MTDFSHLLQPGGVAADIVVANKKSLFQQLGLIGARVSGLDPRKVVERLNDRERLGSTGFGAGVAIPHGKVEGLAAVTGAFLRLEKPIEFQAIDDLPVDLVFMLLSPPEAGADHLKALAQVSRWLRDRGFVAKLRGAGSTDALFALFAAQDTRDAA